MEKLKDKLLVINDLVQQAENTRDLGFVYLADDKLQEMIKDIDEAIKVQQLLVKEDRALKHRCSTISRGLMCQYCPMECEFRAEEFDKKNEK